jgi:peptidyl-prolyl cis-trans isomerase SurA
MYRRVVTGVIAAVVLATAVPVRVAAQQGQIIQKVLVKVNGEIFTQTELERRQIQALRERNQQVPNPEALQTDAGLRTALSEVTPALISDAIEELLLLQRARDLGVKFSEEAFQEALGNLKTQNNLNDEQFAMALKQEGLTIEQLRKDFERSYMMQGVQQIEIYPRLQITDEEIRQYYRANPDEFMQPETVMLREIFMEVQTQVRDNQTVINVAQEEEVQAKMNAARDRVLKGEDFATVAAEVSESPSKANGGLIGPVDVAQVAPAMRAIIDALKVGDVSEPVRTSRGFQMLRLETRSTAEPAPFPQVRSQILQKIRLERADAETSRYIDTLREQAQIEWKDENLRALYQKMIAERAAKGGGQA